MQILEDVPEFRRLVDAVLAFSRHHRLRFGGRGCERKDFVDAVSDIFGSDQTGWSAQQTELIECLVALSIAALGLEQVDQKLSYATVTTLLQERLRMYCSALGQPRPLFDPPMLELAAAVRDLRPRIEQIYHRYSIINGKIWYRTEGLIPRRALDHETLPAALDELLRSYGALHGTTETRLVTATRAVIAYAGYPAELVHGFLHAVVTDPQLRIHHATLTCVRGRAMDCPQSWTSSEDFYSATALVPGLDLAEHAARLGHDSIDQLVKVKDARMIKLKRKANAYCGAGPEKAADNFIYHNGDAHYRGHQTIGGTTAARSAFAVTYERDGQPITLGPKMGDLRVVRMGAPDDDLMQEPDLRRVIVYASWLKYIVQETFRSGALMEPIQKATI